MKRAKKKRVERKKGTIWMFVGLLLLAAALFLTVYNLMDAKRAKDAAEKNVKQLLEKINVEEDFTEDEEIYQSYPEMEMPVLEIEGEYYIGIIEISALDLKLPVMSGEWSYEKLKTAPCHYAGSVYMDDLIIAAHNYSSHFGKIKNLKAGDDVRIIDADGHVFQYEVGWFETIKGTDSDSMLEDNDEWDLTLFTCTYSGSERYTVRCIKQK